MKHLLPVPAERVRELSDDEADRLEIAVREDLAPRSLLSPRPPGCGSRSACCAGPEVNFGTGQIVKLGKGGKRVTVSITPTIREIIWPLQGHHPEFVFTYVARRTLDGRVKGSRYPLTYYEVQRYWRLLRRKAGVTGFRFHDYRHDLGTKLLRETGNLKLVQRMLNHADIRNTSRYAHVNDEEVADGFDRVAKRRKNSRRHCGNRLMTDIT